MDILRIAVLGIAGVLLALLLQKEKSEYSMFISMAVCITYVAEFAMNICKDAGYAAVGNQIELFAKLSILVLSIPVLTVFLETVGSFL